MVSSRKMKVFIIGKLPFPNGMAAIKRVVCYARALLSVGVECEVVSYVRTERYGQKPNNTIGKGVFEGIPFRYIGGTPLRGSNVFIRRWNDYVDKLRFLLFLRKNLHAGDIVYGYLSTDVKYANLIIRLVHHCGAKYVRELCELPYGTGKETSSAIRRRHITLKKHFPMCDGMICISDTLYQLAKQYTSENCKLIKVPILVDYDAYEMEDLSQEADYPYIFHSGTLSEQKDGILGMLEAFGLATKKTNVPLHFVSTGSIEKSPHAEDIRLIMSKYSIEDRVTFTGFLSEDELKKYLSQALLVIINKYDNQQNHYCFSTKLAEYLAAAKPVVITDVGEAMNWLRDKESAYIVKEGDTELLASAIVEAIENSEERRRIAQNGKEVCKEAFDYKCYGKTLKNFFEEVR